MGVVENTLNLIETGRKGYNLGFNYSLNDLDKYLKIWTGTYYLYFALSGVGKSKVVNHQHLYNVVDTQIRYELNKNNPNSTKTIYGMDYLHIDYYSLEISPDTVMGGIICTYLYYYENILCDIRDVFSFKGKINENLYKLIHSKKTIEYLKKFEKYVTFYQSLSLDNLMKTSDKELGKVGEIEYEKDSKRIVKYRSHFNKFMYQIIIDHISLTDIIPGKTRYDTVGLISKYLFKMRNIAKITPVVIQQVNPDKTRKIEETVSPSHEDLRDSKETFNDCDVAIAVGDPFKHKLQFYPSIAYGYKINPSTGIGMKDRFRFLEIRKNRYGGGLSRIIPAKFIGECSVYENLPKPDEMTLDNYLEIENIKKTYN